MKVQIKSITFYEKGRDGKDLINPFTKAKQRKQVVTTDAFEGKNLYGWENELSSKWIVSQVIDIDVTENEGKDGKMYLNWKLPTKESRLQEEVDELKIKVKKLEDIVFAEIKGEDNEIPF